MRLNYLACQVDTQIWQKPGNLCNNIIMIYGRDKNLMTRCVMIDLYKPQTMKYRIQYFHTSSIVLFSVPTNSKLDTCEVTGFETRVREECEEVSEIDCRPIQVKKIRTEIRQQCDVKLNKTCDVVFNPAPKDQCSLVMEKRYCQAQGPTPGPTQGQDRG